LRLGVAAVSLGSDQRTRRARFLAGTIHRAAKDWTFYDMTAGNAAPLSVDHYYHP
jgi:hypothetical protein